MAAGSRHAAGRAAAAARTRDVPVGETRIRRVGCLLAVALAGCGQKGTITFQIDVPSGAQNALLSPLSDKRSDSIALVDASGHAIGTPVNPSDPAGAQLAVGDVPVGPLGDVRLDISGGGQLLGLALTRGVEVLPLADTVVTLHARKPVAAIAAATVFDESTPNLPRPDPLMFLDTTLPAVLPSVKVARTLPRILATAATHDGLFLLAASAGTLYLLDTGTLYTAAPVAVTLAPAAGQTAPPTPHAIAISRDDTQAVVVSDQGVTSFPLAAVTTGGGGGALPTVKVAGARAASYSPVDGTLAVLVAPSWDAIDCARPAAATYYRYGTQEGALSPLAGPDAAPPGATALAYDDTGALRFAVPCGSLGAGITGADGVPVVPGPGIYDVVVSGSHVIGLLNTVDAVTPLDPSDSGLRGQFIVAADDGTARTHVQFQVPVDTIAFSIGGNNPPTEIVVTPQSGSVVAYRAAASPDGSNLLFAYRVEYALQDVAFLTLHWADTNAIAYQCTANVVRDVYRLMEVDISTGTIGYQATKGVNDIQPCAITCKACDIFGRNCQSEAPDMSCASSGGFVPDGLSVLMGSR